MQLKEQLSNLFSHFNDGPLWIFTLSKKLNKSEINILENHLEKFIHSWTAHGHSVGADAKLIADQLLFIAANASNSDVTGCSKDKLYQMLHQTGAELQVDFFNRMLIPVLQEDELTVVHWNDVPDLVQDGTLLHHHVYVDGSIATLSIFRTNGLQPLSEILVTM